MSTCIPTYLTAIFLHWTHPGHRRALHEHVAAVRPQGPLGDCLRHINRIVIMSGARRFAQFNQSVVITLPYSSGVYIVRDFLEESPLFGTVDEANRQRFRSSGKRFGL
jgi:hypothetical protein